MNNLQIIRPYKDTPQSLWVFDDPCKGLKKEPFVPSAGLIIDALCTEIPNAAKGFNLLFSDSPFQDYKLRLVWDREEFGGNIYVHKESGAEGWLCPALLKYFDGPPEQIFAKGLP